MCIRNLLPVFFALVLLGAPADAGTWTKLVPADPAADINDTGTLLQAGNIGLNATTVNVGGIEYQPNPANVSGGNDTLVDGLGYYTGPDGDTANLLNTGRETLYSTWPRHTAFDFSGLTIGKTYRFQVFIGFDEADFDADLYVGSWLYYSWFGNGNVRQVGLACYEWTADSNSISIRVGANGDGNPSVIQALCFTLHDISAYKASSPEPALGAIQIALDADLNWSAPTGISEPAYDVYFGTASPPPAVTTGITATSYDPGPMNTYTTYDWRVDVADANQIYQGDLWSFTTLRGPTTFYIDSATGDDSNTGTSPEQAWASLAPVNSTTLISGDKILFKAGTTYTGQLQPQGSGEPENPVIIDMYGTGDRPRIDGEGVMPATLLLENIECYEISNLEITNLGPTREAGRMGVYAHVIDFGPARHIYLKNLYIHDVNGKLTKAEGGGSGIKWTNEGDATPSYFDDLRIEYCHLKTIDRVGIHASSAYRNWTSDWQPSINVVIRGNFLEDIGGNGITPIGTDGCLIEHNLLQGMGQRDKGVGIWPYKCDNTVIQFNDVSGCRGDWDAQGYDSDYQSHNTLFQYNYSHDNEGGFLLVCCNGDWDAAFNAGTVFRYNISVDDGFRPGGIISPTFHITGPVTDTWIYNNTVYVGTRKVIDLFRFNNWGGTIQDWPDNTHIYNNVFYVAGEVNNTYGSATNTIFNNNVFYGNVNNMPTDPNAITGDPLLINPGSFDPNSYMLQPGSPCIQTGTGVSAPYPGHETFDYNTGFDYWRNRIDIRYALDRGAHAYTHTYPGDTDIDGDVDFIDYADFAGGWKTTELQLDLNGDGLIDVTDLALFAEDWLMGI